MNNDKTYQRLIQSTRWQKLRKAVITAHPLCVVCEAKGLLTPASEVHHITPVEYGLNPAEQERLAFDPTNLQALCHACHVAVHMEMGRSGKAASRRRTRARVEAFIKKFYGQ